MNRPTSLANRFIDPLVLAGSSNLHLIARTVVEGFVSGLHRSPYHGFSLEFSEYREYTPGDDIRRVDWKVFGRSDRFYVKKFRGDTNTQVFLLLDTSASMAYRSEGLSKIDYARFLAASLAYFGNRQHDAVGLLRFDSEIRSYLPPRSRHGHLLTLLSQLEQVEVGGVTRISDVLKQFSSLIRKRSLVILISDLYEESEQVGKALRFFHHRGNDVLLFHILDPVELEMPLSGISTLQDMETGEQVPFVAESSRRAYLEALQNHIAALKKECQDVQIQYEVLNTALPLDQALFRFLSARNRRI